MYDELSGEQYFMGEFWRQKPEHIISMAFILLTLDAHIYNTHTHTPMTHSTTERKAAVLLPRFCHSFYVVGKISRACLPC